MVGTPVGPLAGLLFVVSLSACVASKDPREDAAAPTQAEERSRELEMRTKDLSGRPAASSATSATEVLTFRSVLENPQITREERIRALQNLDPGALQKPVAQANVTGGPRPAAKPASRDDASAHRGVPVVMYSTSWCGVCRKARKYLAQRGIAFEEHDVDEDPDARTEYLQLNPRGSVPTIKIGSQVIVGFSPAAVERALDSGRRL